MCNDIFAIKDKYEVLVDRDGYYYLEISEGDWEAIWEMMKYLDEELEYMRESNEYSS